MREFVFTVGYERGADEVMGLLIENPDLHSKTMAIRATSESMWRLDHLIGPTEALEAFDEVIEQTIRCNGVLGVCGMPVVEQEYEVLSETPSGHIVCSCREESDGIQSIPRVAAKHIGDGLLMQAERRETQNQWRLLTSDDDTVNEIYEEVKGSLSDGLSLSVRRISEPECWLEKSISADGLPPEQQAAFEAAIEFGYYETPRQHTVQEISEELDIPSSTLQYRLTHAEAWLVRQFVTGTLGTEVEDRVGPEQLKASVWPATPRPDARQETVAERLGHSDHALIRRGRVRKCVGKNTFGDTTGLSDDLGIGDDLARADQRASTHADIRRYGKPVTVVGGLDPPADELNALASTLKRRLAVGGTVIDGRIKLQGEHGEHLEAALRDEGFGVER